MKKVLYFIAVCCINIANAQIPTTVDSAYAHLKEQFDRYHSCSYVYSDDNDGGNLFIPSVFQGDVENTGINQSFTANPYSGRSCTEIKFPLIPGSSFGAIKYVYPVKNIGTYQGFNLSGATELSFRTRGSGIVEFQLGGMNRRPFHSDTLPHQDGADIRSSGLIELSSDWVEHTIDLTDNTFWVYLDSTAGLNNKYLQPKYMGNTSPNGSYYFDFHYGSDDGQGGTCMETHWFGNNYWGGIYLFPPEGDWEDTQGYDLTGIDKVRFKAKISESGDIQILFGKEDDSSGKQTKIFTLSTDWQWYEWDLNDNLDYSNVVGGFGLVFNSNGIGTPNNSSTFIDSVYYEGVELASDFSNLICGFSVSANKLVNPDTVFAYIDQIKYNKDRTDRPRFCQSYVCGSDSIDMTQKNVANSRDNALKMISDLLLYDTTTNSQFLNDAKLLGDAFIYALNHDRYFNDGRIRNAYKSGELINFDSTVNMSGWWGDSLEVWREDSVAVSTYTGTVAWVGLALTSLYEATNDNQYLDAAEELANWCIDSTQTTTGYAGYTGGFVGSDSIQTKVNWKSTEDNIALYALFSRLECITSNSSYQLAKMNAKQFVYALWKEYDNFFWSGTTEDGMINDNFLQIPAHIQSLYILAFNDTTSQYRTGIEWARQNCYFSSNSPNYSQLLYGYDYNKDKDGIWFEGSCQAALANRMMGKEVFAEDSILNFVEFVQIDHVNPKFYNFNTKGIVSADHNHTTTGSDWEYHNRLSLGATCWYIFAKLGLNPFYYHCFPSTSISNELLATSNRIHLFQNSPNPFNTVTTIKFDLPESAIVKIEVFNHFGQKIETLLNKSMTSGTHQIEFNAADLTQGVYLCKIIAESFGKDGKFQQVKRMVVMR